MRVQPRTRTSGEGGFLRFPCPWCCCFCACCCWPCWPSTRCFLAAGSMPPCCSCSGSMAAAPVAPGRAVSLGSRTDHRPWAAAWLTFRDVLNAGRWAKPASNLQAAQGRGASDRLLGSNWRRQQWRRHRGSGRSTAARASPRRSPDRWRDAATSSYGEWCSAGCRREREAHEIRPQKGQQHQLAAKARFWSSESGMQCAACSSCAPASRGATGSSWAQRRGDGMSIAAVWSLPNTHQVVK